MTTSIVLPASMRPMFAAFLFLIVGTQFAPAQVAYGDERFVGAVVDLLREGRYHEASVIIDGRLKQNPDDVDALMLRGNLIFYSGTENEPSIALFTSEEETIYDESIGFFGEGAMVIRRTLADSIAVPWYKALGIDPSRTDIHKGLCYVLSLAGKKEDLILHLPKLHAALGGAPEEAYGMGSYARMFAERGSVEDCIDVYHAIEGLYPDHAGLASDIGANYLLNGDFPSAARYMEKAAGLKNPDEMVFGNLALIRTILGDYDAAVDAMRKQGEMVGDESWMIFAGILAWYKNDPEWKSPIRTWFAKAGKEAENGPMAERLLSDESKDDYERYLGIIEGSMPTQFLIVMHRRAADRFPDRFRPAFNLAEIFTYYGNYAVADSIYRSIEKRGLAKSEDEREDLGFHHAWALQALGKSDEADLRWKEVAGSAEIFRSTAAIYFLGKNAMTRGDRDAADDYFASIADTAGESKYANMARRRLEKIDVGE